MEKVKTLYTELRDHLSDLEKQFIAAFLPTDPSLGPADYGHSVKAYCVLSHAALEDYFENITLHVMSRSIEEWTNHRTMSETILTLTCYYGLKLNVIERDGQTQDTVFTYLRPVVEEAKRRFSKDIHENHGVSLKHLVKLLIPVGIDIMQDVNPLNSISQLAKERGTYAHKKSAQRILSPEDAKQFVEDCLLLCDDTRAKAIDKLTSLEA